MANYNAHTYFGTRVLEQLPPSFGGDAPKIFQSFVWGFTARIR